jgi:N-acetylmuramoyl-L-alanine amidase
MLDRPGGAKHSVGWQTLGEYGTVRQQVLGRAQQISLIIALLAAVAGGWTIYRWLQRQQDAQSNLFSGMRVGIVAGHSGYDSGAVCPDGLTEAEVNLDIAERVAERLVRVGARVDILEEYDQRLYGYVADAFVSIHADSCESSLSGFKVARVEQSAVPLVEDRLVDCLWKRYGEITGLARHPGTITHDMRDYHAFREINPQTPGAIIEVGFMGGDRRLLTRQPEVAAKGVAEGIICFLAGPADTSQ